MENDAAKKVYKVRKVGERYVIHGKMGLVTDLSPKFLAMNPADKELFLLFGDHGSYSLLKGSEEKGMRFCIAKASQLFGNCFAFVFEEEKIYSAITDPDSLKRQQPIYDDFEGNLIKLTVVPFKIYDTAADEIIDFVAEGHDLLSEEGQKLIHLAERADIREAAKKQEVWTALGRAREKSKDPHLRRQILLALSD